MKKTLFLTVICLLLLVFNQETRAANLTGGKLLSYCKSDKGDELLSCVNYVAGVIDYHIFMQSMGTTPTTDFCIPDSVSVDKASFVVMNYLEKHQEHLPFIAAPTVLMALADEYPCAELGGK